MYGASGPNITQAVNPVSKYKKHASNAFQFPLRSDAITCFIVSTPDGVCVRLSCFHEPKKTANGTHLQRCVRVGGIAYCRFTEPAPCERLAPLAREHGATCVPLHARTRHTMWINLLGAGASRRPFAYTEQTYQKRAQEENARTQLVR